MVLRHSLLFITTSTLFSIVAHAQQAVVLNPSQIPACALQCPILLAAQEQCVPPYRPTTNQPTYNACFCASDYLTAFKNGQTTGYCEGVCSQQDMQTLLVWFRGTVCQSQADPAGTATITAAVGATGQPTTTMVNGRTTTIAASAATGTAGAQRINTDNGRSWIAANYRWVILVVVLILAAILAVFLGCWWKHRRQRRHKNDPNRRDSTTIANEVAASFADKHPIASPPMSHTPYVQRSSSMAAAAPPTMQQRSGSILSRPTTAPVATTTWQGGAAGVGAAGIGGSSSSGTAAAAAAALAAMRSGINRQPNGSSFGRLMHHQQSISDLSPVSTPDIADRHNPTPLSMSDRPLLASTPELFSTTSPSPRPGAALAANASVGDQSTARSPPPARPSSSKLTKSNSKRIR